MNGNSEVHLPQDCIEVVEWDHVDVPGGYEGYSHVARASVDLPISSDLLYFLGRGVLSHGVIRFVDAGEQDADVASVDVAFLYDENRLSDLLKVCRLHKSDSKNGVGIFVSIRYELNIQRSTEHSSRRALSVRTAREIRTQQWSSK